jgi:hypothetical protein
VHPNRIGRGEYSVRVGFPVADDYMLFADFVPEGAVPQELQFLIAAPASPGAPPTELGIPNLDPISIRDMRISVELEEFRAGTPTLLTFRFSRLQSGDPVNSLQPYLGAVGHLFFTNADFTDASHSHPLENGSGPSIRFLTRFNSPGLHKVWLQFKHNDQVETVSWLIDVPPARR